MISEPRGNHGRMSGKIANTALMVARGAGVEIAFNAEGPSDWIMLMPAGSNGVLTTVDGRGPYRIRDAQQLATDSLQAASGRMPIDENHATDLAAPSGRPSPARGWATALQAREEGIFAQVEWSGPGAALMSERAYRFISPVFTHDAAGNVIALLRASLTNTPNLRGMAALHTQESAMDLLARLRSLLGLADDSDEEAVLAKVQDGCSGSAALQSIGLAAGLGENADVTAIASAVTALAAGVPDAVRALQGELAAVTTRLNNFTSATARDKATAFVDGEIGRGRVGVKPLRDRYIAMHAADPAGTEQLIAAMPLLGPSGALRTAPAVRDGKVALSAEQMHAADLLGIKHEDYASTLASEIAA
jgi:phage I-like protein